MNTLTTQPDSMDERIEKLACLVEGDPADGNLEHYEVVQEIINLVRSEITLAERAAEERVLRDIDSIIFTSPFMIDEVAASVRTVRRKISDYAKAKGITL